MGIDLENASLFDLAFELDPSDESLCREIDEYIPHHISDIDDLMQIYFQLCYGDMYILLPKTKDRINELLFDELDTKDNKNINWALFTNFRTWLSKDIKQKLISEWLEHDDVEIDQHWIIDSNLINDRLGIEVLKKLVRLYKKNKKSNNVKIIESIFIAIPKENLSEACDLVSKSTPAVAVSLLQRNDIDDKFTINGLRALSKLSKQRDLDITIDFETLGHLGPKGRLDAMKQLMGMFDKYYQFINDKSNMNSYGYSWREKKLKKNYKGYSLPFKQIPDMSEIERFLFPCSLKYNNEVVNMVKRFEELISQKEKDNGQSISKE